MPSTAGQYEFRLYSNNNTLLATSSAITVSSSAVTSPPAATGGSGVSFPLKISANRKYLVDQNEQPFLIVGDAAWSMAAQPTQSDVTRYLDDRKSRGFTAILFEMMEHLYTSHTPSWANAYGQVPFANNNDFTTVNEAYMAQVDWLVQQALNRGLLLFITPAYWGSNPGVNGWGAEMKANGVAKLTAYGKYLGNRYRAYPNIVWVHGGDWTPSTSGSPSELDLVSAIANGIISAGGGQLHTAHWKGHSDAIPGLSWLDLDASYFYNGLHTYAGTLANVTAETGVRPGFFLEGTYENSPNQSDPSPNTVGVFRAQMYQPILSGQMGFFFGNTPIWYFGVPGDGDPVTPLAINPNVDWVTSLNSPGSRSAATAARFFTSIAWSQLNADTAHVLATAGYGSYGSDYYALAALSNDRRLGVIYYTSRLTVTVNLSSMAGPVNARWFDPATGNYTTIGSSSLPNSGSITFTPPGTNGDGFPDWVLLLQSN
jgi:hypothetical protein